jgi:hypothetical protein
MAKRLRVQTARDQMLKAASDFERMAQDAERREIAQGDSAPYPSNVCARRHTLLSPLAAGVLPLSALSLSRNSPLNAETGQLCEHNRNPRTDRKDRPRRESL